MAEPEATEIELDSPSARPDPGQPRVERILFTRSGPELQATPLTPRDRLIEAGWAEAADLPLSKAFAGVTTAAIAQRAGVTTGSFFHHFRNASEFADAMALGHAMPEESSEQPRPPAGLAEPNEFIDLLELIRIALTETWRTGSTSEVGRARFDYEMRLWSFHTAQLSNPDESFRTVGDIIGRNYQIRQRQAAGMWLDALARSGRELIHPFDLDTVATAITALYEGLMLRSAVDPDAVGPALFAEVSAALVNYFTGPVGLKATFDKSSVQLTGGEEQSPQARSGAKRRRETWTRIVAASSGMFANGWETVSATEIADRAGTSAQTVLNLFHSVRRVAAATFVIHANELYEFSLESIDEDPMTGLRETISALSQRTSVSPEAARALLSERIQAGLHRGNSMTDLDIRIEVPVGAAIGVWLGRLGFGGDRATALSAAITNFVLATTLTGGLETSEIVAMAMRLVPDEAGQGSSASPVVT